MGRRRFNGVSGGGSTFFFLAGVGTEVSVGRLVMMYVQRTDVHRKPRRPEKKTRKKKGVVVVTYLNLSADELFARGHLDRAI